MRRSFLATTLSTGTLLLGLVVLPPTSPVLARATGVVATVTAIAPGTGLATLQTEAGEVFTLPKAVSWRIGTRVACERVEDASQSRLEHCQPWQ